MKDKSEKIIKVKYKKIDYQVMVLKRLFETNGELARLLL